MRRKTLGDNMRGSFSMSAGWLFADLLLVLAMLFLAANTMGIHPPPPPTPTPTPTPIVHITPTPKERVLEHNYCEIKLNDGNPNTLSQNLDFAKSTLEPQINSINYLQGRQVGLAIASGGVDNSNNASDRARGIAMADKTYAMLQDLAQHGSLFRVASYYSSLYTPTVSSGQIVLDFYLIVRSDNAAETCDANTHLPV